MLMSPRSPLNFRLLAAAGLATCFSLLSYVRAEDAMPQAKVPLKRIVLFNSGVGFFEHGADIDGDAQVELKFNVENVNDLLKSMVLQDLGGGRVSTVTYGSQDPITKTLKTFAIDLTSNPTLAQLLEQVRGEKVEIDAPNPVSGTILGVETRKQKVGDDVVEIELLNLLTSDGLRSVKLESVGRIKLANEKLDGELRQALAVLAMGHDNEKKSVTLQFLGAGKRPVRVGYVQEAPIWKTSYRLVLSDQDPPFLQGWAIVENTTEEDWDDVSLTLVSGRPISFIMNLYQPLYVPRPVVEPELFASLRPQLYGQDLDRKQAEFAEKAKSEEQLGGRRMAKRARAMPLGDAAPAAPMAAGGGFGLAAARGEDKSGIALNRGVESLAEAGDVGELFQYVIDSPVTLARQKSAMLPIINDSVQGEKLSIYNEQVQAKHPLNGLRLKNTSDLYLMQGPITVFDDGAYAGDAQIEDLPPGSERLLSYALDLKTEVASEIHQSGQQLVKCRLVKGALHTTNKLERRRNYTIKNSGREKKKVLVEYAVEAGWTLLVPKEPSEKTRDRYRFAVAAEPGKSAKLEVAEEMTVSQQIALTNLDDNAVRYYINAKVVSDKVKEALAEVIRRKQQISEVAARKQQLEQQITAIDQEQNRIRQNMQQLDRNSDLYRRYVKKFSEQEDEVEKLRGQIASLATDLGKRQSELDAFLVGLELE
ncbi:MAG TPA: hypothetical protein VFI31_27820 [Pirellulales bacterium]|nr:hypothetical protein [Pirellulales bacterium]